MTTVSALQSQTLKTSAPRILLVEDEYLIALELQSMLEELGYECLGIAGSREQAKTMLSVVRPDLVLLDLSLGKNPLEGIDLAHELREKYQLPFIFVSSHVSQEVVEQARITMAYGYLLKPVNKNDLYAAIEVAFHKARYDEIAIQEKEKSFLLRITEALSTIGSMQELFQVIFHQLQPVFQFDDAVVVCYSEEQHATQLLHTFKPFPKGPLHSLYQHITSHLIPVNTASPYSELLRLKSAETKPIAFFTEKFPTHPGSVLMEALGISEILVLPLQFGGKVIGTLEFLSKESSRHRLFPNFPYRNLANQIAIAVANLQAKEEAQKREEEKSILLNLGETLARVRDKQELFSLMLDQLRPLFHFSDGVIVYYDEVSHSTQHLHALPYLDAYLKNAHFQRIMRSPVPVDEHSPYKAFLLFEGPTLLPLSYFDRYPDHLGVKILNDFQLKESLIMPLRYGNRILGTLEFHYQEPGIASRFATSLYQGLANQMAVAVSNILANEHILQRERERRFQVQLINALNFHSSWNERYFAFIQVLQEYIPFDLAIIGADVFPDSVEGMHGFYRIGKEEYQQIDHQAFLSITKLAPARLNEMRKGMKSQEPLLLNGQDLFDFCEKQPLKAITVKSFQLNSHLVMPIYFSTHEPFVISLYRKERTGDFRTEEFDLLEKAVPSLSLAIEKLLMIEEVSRLRLKAEQEKEYLKEEIKNVANFEEIVGHSEPMKIAYKKVNQVSPTDATVLLEGETGTGKELFARAIHNSSPRKNKVFVKINCATLPAQLVESELFGHEKGAFTGAIEQRIGKFELAHGGTLFLDEIGELPLELQAKLLRAIQEKEIERLGGNKLIRCDVRIIAATNRNLLEEVRAGRFRQDLYFRLSVFPIRLPALRERVQDIPLLARYFLEKFARKFSKKVRSFSEAALQDMCRYPWPGNVREMEHLIEYAMIVAETTTLHLPRLLMPVSDCQDEPVGAGQASSPVLKSWTDAERDNILAVLKATRGRIRGRQGAAEILRIKPTTLESRMKKLGIIKQFEVEQETGKDLNL